MKIIQIKKINKKFDIMKIHRKNLLNKLIFQLFIIKLNKMNN